MIEKALGSVSKWFGYLRFLPDYEHIPLVWDTALCDLMKGTELEDSTQEDLAEVSTIYEGLVQPLIAEAAETCADFATVDKDAVSFEAFVKAITLASSRAFCYEHVAGSASTEQVSEGLIPLADLLNHRLPLSPDYRGSYSGSTDVTLRYTSRPTRRTRCSSSSDTTDKDGAVASSSCGMFSLIACRDLTAKGEVYTTYGAMGNASLLHDFGFALSSKEIGHAAPDPPSKLACHPLFKDGKFIGHDDPGETKTRFSKETLAVFRTSASELPCNPFDIVNITGDCVLKVLLQHFSYGYCQSRTEDLKAWHKLTGMEQVSPSKNHEEDDSATAQHSHTPQTRLEGEGEPSESGHVLDVFDEVFEVMYKDVNDLETYTRNQTEVVALPPRLVCLLQVFCLTKEQLQKLRSSRAESVQSGQELAAFNATEFVTTCLCKKAKEVFRTVLEDRLDSYALPKVVAFEQTFSEGACELEVPGLGLGQEVQQLALLAQAVQAITVRRAKEVLRQADARCPADPISTAITTRTSQQQQGLARQTLTIMSSCCANAITRLS
eukprot:scaffold2799_cov408-Prasinococcus_capsulatus_cf.AAC.2